mmetsp:Transcript_19939/g.47517  ORF Transcript_19939/g.47517 Transcript_19939/m.47517 type:complete len:273 (+) Transcript_19939:2536-3354(+)
MAPVTVGSRSDSQSESGGCPEAGDSSPFLNVWSLPSCCTLHESTTSEGDGGLFITHVHKHFFGPSNGNGAKRNEEGRNLDLELPLNQSRAVGSISCLCLCLGGSRGHLRCLGIRGRGALLCLPPGGSNLRLKVAPLAVELAGEEMVVLLRDGIELGGELSFLELAHVGVAALAALFAARVHPAEGRRRHLDKLPVHMRPDQAVDVAVPHVIPHLCVGRAAEERRSRGGSSKAAPPAESSTRACDGRSRSQEPVRESETQAGMLPQASDRHSG